MKRDEKGKFIKGSNGNTYEGFGIWYDKKGYPFVFINNKNIALHIYIWEKKNGEKPKGYDIHHKDFNKKNYSLNNLELLTFSDHRKVHARWVRENGKWILKPCKDCKKKLPLNNFYQRKGLTPSNRCIGCSGIYWKEKLKDNKHREKKRLYLKEYYRKNKIKILIKQKEKYANS